MPDTFQRLYEVIDTPRFAQGGVPRITTRKSAEDFAPRDEGLDVLLINTPVREWSYPNVLPIGQGYVAAGAIMDGHRLTRLDLNADRRVPISTLDPGYDTWLFARLDEALAGEPDVIGIGGIITQYAQIKKICAYCKDKLPDVPIVLGGGVASAMPDFMLKHLPVDYVSQHEGELTFSEILHRIEMGASMQGVAGVTYYETDSRGEKTEIRRNPPRRTMTAEQLGHMPWPLRHLWDIENTYRVNPVGHLNQGRKWNQGAPESGGKFSAEMIASRGCPYTCEYCFSDYLGTAYRSRPPADVVREMEYLHYEYGVEYIEVLDDLMLTSYKWALEFYAELHKSGLPKRGVEWGGTCRTNILANDIVRAAREGRGNMLELGHDAGLRRVAYGVETGSPTILKVIDKSGQTPATIKTAVQETVRVLGYASCSFMFGSPGETAETIRETVDLCIDMDYRPEVFFFTTAYPGTVFWQLALDKGLIRKSVDGIVGPADDSIIERYLMGLGEQGDAVRTNFSDLPDDVLLELTNQAAQDLNSHNSHRHPYQDGAPNSIVRDATHATI